MRLPEPTGFGLNGPAVSALGLGTVKWGRNTAIKYPSFALPDNAALHRLLDTACELGINFLDTAPAYGIAEARIGEMLAERKEPWVIFSKAGEAFDGTESRYRFDREFLTSQVEESLRKLRVERLDGVALHCPRADLDFLSSGEAFETLNALRDAGKIHLRGISLNSVDAGLLAVDHVDYLMATYNLDEHDHLPVIRKAAEHGLGIQIKKALNSGKAASPAESLRLIAGLPGAARPVIGTLNPLHLAQNAAAWQTGAAE